MNAALWLVLVVPFASAAHSAEGEAAGWVHTALTRAADAAGEISDPFHRAQAFAEIADTHAATGGLDAAREHLRLSAGAANQVDNDALASWARHDIALSFVRADDIAAAETMAATLRDIRMRDAVFGHIVEAQRTAQDVPGALAAARRISDPAEQGQSLRAIALLQANTGDLDGALATARSIVHAGVSAQALGDMAGAFAKDGDFEHAHQLAARVRNAQRRDRAFADVAAAEAEAGNIKGALTTVERVEDKLARAEALARIAAARANYGAPSEARGMLAEGIATVKRTRARSYRKGEVLIEIARAQLAIRDGAAATEALSLALANLAGVQNAARLALISRIMPLQAKAGDFGGALKTALRADDPSLRPLLVRDLATAQAEAGDVAGAVAAARGLDDESAAAAFFGILHAQLKANDVAGMLVSIDAAMRTVRAIRGTELRAAALGGLAAVQVAAGDSEAASRTFDEALAAAAAAEPGRQRSAAYARIADAVANRGR